jgi:hypothetical protein
MRRAHRSAHRLLWVMVTLAVAATFALALSLREPPPA